jgi:lipoprotein-anchoring transpeptidase ErfK/SrfK
MALPSTHFLAVDRENHWLTRYRRKPLRSTWVRAQRYRIAVGALGFETPRGLFEITGKALDPVWLPPDSDWVGPDLRDPDTGKPVPIPGGDPRNPLKGAFLSIWDRQDPHAPEAGIGIHGTAALESLGTNASHGCIRVAEEVAVQLHRIIPVGTAVYII